MVFVAEYFMELRDDLIVWPPYTLRHWMRALMILLGSEVGSHLLPVETDLHITREDRVC